MVVALTTKDFPAQITKELLDGFVGKKVEDFCSIFGKIGDEHNHCAHFVSHVLGFRIGQLCNSMTFENRNNADAGRTMRVNELFNYCSARGYWPDKPKNLDPCLVFATLKDQIAGEKDSITIGTHPRKHVGIYFQGNIYHYGNSLDKVRRDGISLFQGLYGSKTVVLYADFPK